MGNKEDIKQLERDLDTIKPIAEWLAIYHDKTRLQWNKYIKDAGELLDYLDILGYRKFIKE